MTFTGRGLRARGARWTARAVAAALLVLAAAAGAQPEALERRLCEADLAPAGLRPDDFFGCALAAAGGRLVVGSVRDDGAGADAGAVYVFTAGRGGPRETAYLTARGVAPGDLLGFAVATDGERLVAGAPFHDGAARDAGTAWVFRRGNGGWAEEAELAVGGFAGGLGRVDLAGYAVAIDGARAALGAPGDDDRGDAAGAVYLFEASAAGAWRPVAKLTDAAGTVGDGFGSSVALDGDTLLVGAPYRGRGAGAVVVFRRGADGMWRQAETLAGDGAASALFGHSVDLAGGWAVIGARGDDRDGENAGAAWVVRRAGGAFGAAQRLDLPAAERAPGDELGIAVAVDGDRLLVGSRFDDEAAHNAGAAYLFRLEDGAWRATAKLRAARPAAGDELGYAVSVDGDRLYAGAYLSDGRGTDAGSACVASDEDEEPVPPMPEPPPPIPTAPAVTASKSLPGSVVLFSKVLGAGSPVVYAIELVNGGDGTWVDGRGDELTDVVPAMLTGVTATADSGTVAVAGNTVTWNGAIPPGGSVHLAVSATLVPSVPGSSGALSVPGAPAAPICNQATLAASSNGPGVTDDPALPGAADPTCFTLLPADRIPTLGATALALLALLIGAVAVRRLAD